mgnify:CR=1 FL=1
MSLRTETAYKADLSGNAAPHAKAPGSDSEVNAEVVQWPFAFLSRETSILCDPQAGSGATGNRMRSLPITPGKILEAGWENGKR